MNTKHLSGGRNDPADRLAPGVTVVVGAFDDVPEHLFLIHSVEADCVTGIALTGPLEGSYGEPPIELIRGIHEE